MVLAATSETFVAACFIGIPILLVVLHFILSFRKNPYLGAIVPIIWALLSVWIVKESETYVTEMFIFCLGIDVILIGIWLLCRYVMKRAKQRN